MKYWLLVWCTLLAARAHAQAAWPVNPKSKEIEWAGYLPWPSEARTPPQRQALARRWYRTKLAPVPAPNAGAQNRPEPRTYGGVPRRLHLPFVHGDLRLQLNCDVALSASPAGLRYVLSNFDYSWWQDDAGGLFPLADALNNPNVNPESLTFFHEHLTVALANW